MANSIENLIVKIKETSPQSTGEFSIAKIQIYSNEQSLVPIEKYTPQMKTLKQLKDYYEVGGKTYNMVKTMLMQNPCFMNVQGAQFQIVPFNWTDATQSTIKSVAVSIADFNAISNGSLRVKIESSLATREIRLNSTNKNDAMLELTRKYNANIIDDKNVVSLKKNREGKEIGLVSYKQEKDLINQYILEKDKDGYKAVANNIHYKEVNGMNFTGCKTLKDVVDILNGAGFNAVFEVVDDKFIEIKTKGLGSRYTIIIENAISPDVVVDLKNVCFGGATSGYTSTKDISTNLDNLIACGDGALSLEVDGVIQTRYNFDFTSATSFDDIALLLTQGGNTTEGVSPVVKTPFSGVIFSAMSTGIKMTATSTGETSMISIVDSNNRNVEMRKTTKSTKKSVDEEPLRLTGADLYNANYFDGASQTEVAGSDGAETTNGTDGAGDNILEIFQELSVYPDFNGSVITTCAAMSVENIYNLNNELKVSATSGHRVVAVMTLQDPYDVEATSHGVISDWLDTRYLSLYCGGLTGLADLELRSAVVSMSAGQNVFVESKNDLHSKDVVIPHSSILDISFDNEMAEMVAEAGVGALCYFKGGYGWKLTIPSNAGVFTAADMVNMHNIVMTFMFTLANQLAVRKYTNKTNDNIKAIHQSLYDLCIKLTNNGVLSGDVSDFSSVIGDIVEAKKRIQGTSYHTYIYSPDAKDIRGKKIPITCYMGFAGSVCVFELENVYLK